MPGAYRRCSFRKKSIRDIVMSVMADGKTRTCKEIWHECQKRIPKGDPPIPSVASTLTDLVELGRLSRTSSVPHKFVYSLPKPRPADDDSFTDDDLPEWKMVKCRSKRYVKPRV
jgi:hypothetical protein